MLVFLRVGVWVLAWPPMPSSVSWLFIGSCDFRLFPLSVHLPSPDSRVVPRLQQQQYHSAVVMVTNDRITYRSTTRHLSVITTNFLMEGCWVKQMLTGFIAVG